MIVAGMLSAMLVAALLACAAQAAEWGLERAHRATRWTWGAAGALAVLLPLVRVTAMSSAGARSADAGAMRAPWRLPALIVPAHLPPGAPTTDALLLVLWGATSLFYVGRLAWRFRRLQSMRARWMPTSIDGVAVLESTHFGPAVVGIVRPVVVVPAWVRALPPAARALVLRHEQEHLRAGDGALRLAAEFVRALMPWNLPLAFIVHRLRGAVEVDCDRRVLTAGHVAPRAYATLILDVAGQAGASPDWVPALSPTYAHLHRRILAMTRPVATSRRPLLGSTVVAMLLVSVACSTEVPAPEARTREVPVPDLDRTVVTATPGAPGAEPPYFEFQVHAPAQARPSSGVPRYPDALRAAGVEGEVLVQFVVDTAGLAEPGSVQVLKSTHALFSQAVTAAIPAMRFEPARLDGRHVRQLVQQPFSFALAR